MLFICSGNSSRSAFAERYAVHAAARYQLSLRFESAGLEAASGVGMNELMAGELHSRGAWPGGFRSRQVDSRLVFGAALVLTMSRRQQLMLTTRYPAATSSTFMLGHAARIARGLGTCSGIAGLREAVNASGTPWKEDGIPDAYPIPELTATVADLIAMYVDDLVDNLAG